MGDMDSMNNDYIDYNNKFAYPLQWLWESMPARIEYQQWCYRVNLAMEGKPFKNLYQEELRSNILKTDDQAKQKEYLERCNNLPEGRSFVLAEAVETAANQLASGVDTYEYQVNDPYGIINDDTEANLAACCQQDYVENKLGIMAATFTRDLRRYGMCAVVVDYDKKRQKNVVKRINPKNTWWDTMYSSTGSPRFCGYSTMIDWNTLKKMVEQDDEINLDIKAPTDSIFNEKGELREPKDKEAKLSRRKIRSLNGLDIYVGDINKLAVAPSLQGFSGQFYWDYDHDLRSCYNLNWYHTFATDPKAMTKSGYHGMDVELTVIYDLNRKIEFKIINRRFVISMNKSAFRRNIAFPIFNPIDDSVDWRVEEFELQCPLKIQWADQENPDKFAYPTSILFPLLDLHDELCAWRAKRKHVSQILSVLRIMTNGGDARSLQDTLNIMGVVLDDIQGDINSLNLQYSYDPIDSQIAHLEQTIKERLNAYNQFDAMQAMGDRASAAESGMAIGAIAQGLSTLQNALMELYADIARQMIANRVVYSPNQEFGIYNLGNYSSITIQEMALDAIVTVKSKMAKKVQERMLATNALQLIPLLSQGIFDQNGIGVLVEQATMGNIPRRMAATFMQAQQPTTQELALAQQQAENEAMALMQNQAMYEANPLPYEAEEVMSTSTPDEIDEVIAGVSASPEGDTFSIEGLDMIEQPGAMATSLEGQTSDSGSALANPNAVIG